MKIFISMILSVCYLLAFSYEEARDNAIESKKPMIVMVTTKGCPWCKKMRNEVLSDSDIKKFIEENFVFIELDKSVAKDFLYSRYFPTTYIIDGSNENILYEIYGFKNKIEFLKELDEFKKPLI